MDATVQKWGNSLAVRIPNMVVKELDLTNGATVTIKTEKGKIIIEPSGEQSLKEMLARVTPETIHPETNTGVAVGKEIID